MESKSDSRALRRKALLFRYYPYATGCGFAKEGMKKEVVQLGIEFSVYVVESMFLLCDDIRSMLRFCYKLWSDVCDYPKPDSPVVERLLRVIHYVYSKDIKPKKRVYQDGGKSVQWEFIRTSWMDFTDGTVILHRLVDILRKDMSFDNRLLLSAIEKYKQQVLKKLCWKWV